VNVIVALPSFSPRHLRTTRSSPPLTLPSSAYPRYRRPQRLFRFSPFEGRLTAILSTFTAIRAAFAALLADEAAAQRRQTALQTAASSTASARPLLHLLRLVILHLTLWRVVTRLLRWWCATKMESVIVIVVVGSAAVVDLLDCLRLLRVAAVLLRRVALLALVVLRARHCGGRGDGQVKGVVFAGGVSRYVAVLRGQSPGQEVADAPLTSM
jgi:hypothetical protein